MVLVSKLVFTLVSLLGLTVAAPAPANVAFSLMARELPPNDNDKLWSQFDVMCDHWELNRESGNGILGYNIRAHCGGAGSLGKWTNWLNIDTCVAPDDSGRLQVRSDGNLSASCYECNETPLHNALISPTNDHGHLMCVCRSSNPIDARVPTAISWNSILRVHGDPDTGGIDGLWCNPSNQAAADQQGSLGKMTDNEYTLTKRVTADALVRGYYDGCDHSKFELHLPSTLVGFCQQTHVGDASAHPELVSIWSWIDVNRCLDFDPNKAQFVDGDGYNGYCKDCNLDGSMLTCSCRIPESTGRGVQWKRVIRSTNLNDNLAVHDGILICGTETEPIWGQEGRPTKRDASATVEAA